MAKLFLALTIFVSMGGCAHSNPKKIAESSIPASSFQSNDPDQITVAVVGINDFHGSLLAKERKLVSPQGERIIRSGGAPALATMISTLKEEMKGRVFIVDAGDDWQGTLESNLVQGASVVEFFNRLGVDVAAIGNHEFDFNLEHMQTRFKESRFPHLALNVFEKKNKRRPNWKNVFPSKIFEVGTGKDAVKIGVIGLSTVDTPSTTRYEFVKHLDFRDPIRLVNDESVKLRKNGAQAVLVTAHAGTLCENKNLSEWHLFSAKDVQGKCEDAEISRFAKGIKPNALDGIIAGHTHQVIHHWLSGIPTIQDEAYNQYFNILYLTFDRGTGKVIPDLTKIEGLIPICTETFAGLHHCDVRRLAAHEFPKMEPAMFHGKPVIPDPAVEAWLKPIVASTEKYRKDVIATSVLPLTHYRDREGAFGNLVADALREKAHTDFSLANSGGIRTSLDAGPITFDGIFRALPFDNLLNVIRLKGKDVKLLFRIATAGSHGIVGFSGLKIKLIPYDREVPKQDLNGDGKQESWEANRLVEIKTSDGKDLKDDQYYSVATYDFLVNGGDDLIWFMKRIPEKDISRKHSDYCRNIVTEYLKTRPVFNTPENPLVDPQNPRVTFQE